MTLSAFRVAAISLSFVIAACGGDGASDTSTDTAQTGGVDTGQHGAVTLDTAAQATDTAGIVATSDLRKINLNTATDAEMRTIPGVGDKMVHEFEEYRPYRSIAQFRKEIGKYVDEATVAEYEKYAFVPVDPNESDAATLQQIPGVDATVAEQLIAARPYASTEAFLEKLRTSLTPEQAQAAAMYIATK